MSVSTVMGAQELEGEMNKKNYPQEYHMIGKNYRLPLYAQSNKMLSFLKHHL